MLQGTDLIAESGILEGACAGWSYQENWVECYQPEVAVAVDFAVEVCWATLAWKLPDSLAWAYHQVQVLALHNPAEWTHHMGQE